jgi:hypothetical protein
MRIALIMVLVAVPVFSTVSSCQKVETLDLVRAYPEQMLPCEYRPGCRILDLKNPTIDVTPEPREPKPRRWNI